MDVAVNPVYKNLDADRRHMVDVFIDFLYDQQTDMTNADETASVVQSALRGEDLIGPFKTVDDMMRSLNA